MDGEHAASAVQAHDRDATGTPHLAKPPAKADTIPAAAVFKKRKLDTPQLRPSSRPPQRPTVKKTSRKTEVEELQPLALAFKESSEDYRRYLYATAVARINKDLDTLLDKLYESNLQVASSGPANYDSQASPLKLTVPVKYQRLVLKLCKPLSSHRCLLQHANPSGEIERAQITVHDRFQLFEQDIQAETEVIKNLQRQWEGVVAEIFQLGVACLGEDKIAALLSTTDPDAERVEPTLFIPEHGSSVHKGPGKRKRVSFAGPDLKNLFPGFLFHTSGQQKKPIPASSDLHADEVQQLARAIMDLGKQHVTDLQRLEKEHQAWWKKKQTKLAHTFLQD